MIIPEIPLINLILVTKVQCPACAETIGSHLVKKRFSCPFCNQTLVSNKEKILNKAIVSAIILYVAFVLIINFASLNNWALFIFMLSGGITPILVGFAYYKIKLKVNKDGDVL